MLPCQTRAVEGRIVCAVEQWLQFAPVPAKATNYIAPPQSENDFSAGETQLRDLDAAGESENDLPDGVAFEENGLTSREAFFASGRNDGAAIGRRDV